MDNKEDLVASKYLNYDGGDPSNSGWTFDPPNPTYTNTYFILKKASSDVKLENIFYNFHTRLNLDVNLHSYIYQRPIFIEKIAGTQTMRVRTFDEKIQVSKIMQFKSTIDLYYNLLNNQLIVDEQLFGDVKKYSKVTDNIYMESPSLNTRIQQTSLNPLPFTRGEWSKDNYTISPSATGWYREINSPKWTTTTGGWAQPTAGYNISRDYIWKATLGLFVGDSSLNVTGIPDNQSWHMEKPNDGKNHFRVTLSNGIQKYVPQITTGDQEVSFNLNTYEVIVNQTLVGKLNPSKEDSLDLNIQLYGATIRETSFTPTNSPNITSFGKPVVDNKAPL